MELNKYINIGDRVEIVNVLDEDNFTSYFSKLVDFNQDEVTLEAPVKDGVLAPLPVNKIFEIYFFSISDGYYQIKAKLFKRVKENGDIPILIFKITSDIRKIQRRQFFRFECNLKVKIREPLKNGNVDYEKEVIDYLQSEYLDGTIKDISGGGMKVNCEVDFEKDSKIDCILTIGKKEVWVSAIVIRSIKIRDNDKMIYQLATRFDSISESTRDIVFKYILEEQRKLIKKGMV